MAGLDFPEERTPTVPFILSLLGGLFVFFGGVALMLVGSVAGSLGFGAASAVYGGLGFLGAFMGLIIVLLAILLLRNPDGHTGYGIAILVFSLLSVFGGAGFILGLLLGVIGGIAAIVFDPEVEDLPPGLDVGPRPTSGRLCPNCRGSVAATAVVCPYCETLL